MKISKTVKNCLYLVLLFVLFNLNAYKLKIENEAKSYRINVRLIDPKKEEDYLKFENAPGQKIEAIAEGNLERKGEKRSTIELDIPNNPEKFLLAIVPFKNTPGDFFIKEKYYRPKLGTTISPSGVGVHETHQVLKEIYYYPRALYDITNKDKSDLHFSINYSRYFALVDSFILKNMGEDKNIVIKKESEEYVIDPEFREQQLQKFKK